MTREGDEDSERPTNVRTRRVPAVQLLDEQIIIEAGPLNWRVAKFLWRARRLVRRQKLDSDNQAVVVQTGRSQEILERARELAGEGRDNRAGVDALNRFAGEDRRSLQLAALAARQGGVHRDDRVSSLTLRLLDAAVADADVTPLSREDELRLRELEVFEALSQEQKWTRLTHLSPGLAEFEGEARLGKFGDSSRLTTDGRGTLSRKTSEANLRQRGMLHVRLSNMLGPQASADDAVTASSSALSAAERYLAALSDAYWARH